MRRRQEPAADHQFLMQLFAAAQPDRLDLDIAIGVGLIADRITRRLDHLPRQIADQYRLTHVEHIDLTAIGIGTGQEHQPGRFLHRHEIARDIGMGHRHRAAARNLVLKQRHHRAGGAEHIAEPHHGKGGQGRARRQILHHQFGQPLAGPHDVGRPHRLVGRHQNEPADPDLACLSRDGGGAQHIVGHADQRVKFNQWHMFIGGGMQHHVDLMVGQHAAHDALIGDRSQQRHQVGTGFFGQRAQVLIDGIKRQFRQFEQHDPLRAAGHHLAAQFRPDGAARAGHQHRFPGIGFGPAQHLAVQPGTAQQAVRQNRAQLVNQSLFADQLGERRQGLHLQPQFLQPPGDLALLGLRQRRHRQQHPVDVAFPRDVADPHRAMHLEPRHGHALHGDIVIDKGHRLYRLVRFQR